MLSLDVWSLFCAVIYVLLMGSYLNLEAEEVPGSGASFDCPSLSCPQDFRSCPSSRVTRPSSCCSFSVAGSVDLLHSACQIRHLF